nr:isopropylmalate/citramalate isomerase large subunit [uncultured archaeon]
MGMTITEKILARASGKERVVPGETIEAKIDVLMMHDVTSTGAIKLLKKNFGNNIAEGLKIVVVPDHYVPNKDIESAKLYKELKEFVEEQQGKGANIFDYMLEGGDYGVCHVMLPEKGHVIPGQVIVGGDSHTCTYGALGAFSTGIGTTEAGNVLATGKLWFRVPESYKIEVDGYMPRNVMAKDLFLRVVGDIGVDGALYQAMEWTGETIRNMSLDERMTLTNMAIEAGAKSGIIEPDSKTISYIAKVRSREGGTGLIIQTIRGREFTYLQNLVEERNLQSDKDAHYSNIKKIDVSGLEPLVAKPHLPSNVMPAYELKNVKIDQAYIGSCTGGKLEDFIAAAEVLKGKRVARGVRLLIVPSTADIQRRIVKDGLYDVFMDAGAVVSAPTCGACLGGYMGILAPGEKCISSTNRNFRGRMGHPDSEVYLASPKTVAASAIKGYIRGAEK